MVVNKMLTASEQASILRNMKPLDEMLRDWQDAMGLIPAEAARRCKLSAQHWGLLLAGERSDLRGPTFNKLAEGTGIAKERLVLAASMLRDRKENERQPEEEAVTA